MHLVAAREQILQQIVDGFSQPASASFDPLLARRYYLYYKCSLSVRVIAIITAYIYIRNLSQA